VEEQTYSDTSTNSSYSDTSTNSSFSYSFKRKKKTINTHSDVEDCMEEQTRSDAGQKQDQRLYWDAMQIQGVNLCSACCFSFASV
jgi:hypothetical protein